MGQAGDVERARWLRVLAGADAAELGRRLAAVPGPEFRELRAPEVGLVMVRGRMGGTGRRFNLGEMTVTRCAVTDGAVVGHGHVRGRDPAKARLVARGDALLQRPGSRDAALAAVVEPLARAEAEAREKAARRAAATRVEFFTLEREAR